MRDVLHVAILLSCWAIGLALFRSWRLTHDSLFRWFGVAFCLMGVERMLLLLIDPANELQVYVYFVRLLAFGLILYAILGKNREFQGLFSEKGSASPFRPSRKTANPASD
jgi:hypothetical protein